MLTQLSSLAAAKTPASLGKDANTDAVKSRNKRTRNAIGTEWVYRTELKKKMKPLW